MRRVIEEIIEKGLIKEGDRVVAGVSGGADSMALACLLKDLQNLLSYDLLIAHVHHGLRGTEADRDLNFVKTWAQGQGLPFFARYVDMQAYAREKKLSPEEAGRFLRHQALKDLAGEKGLVALAHSMDDQAETVLHRILRGTGPDGLQAMREKSDGILRPLLTVSRRDLVDFLRDRGQTYCVDSTNLEDDYTRNYIRHQVFPILKVINPQVKGALVRLASLSSIDQDYLEKEVERIYKKVVKEKQDYSLVDLADLDLFHQAIRFRLYREICSKYGDKGLKDLTYDHLQKIDKVRSFGSGKGLDIKGLRVEKTYHQLGFFSIKKPKKIKLHLGEQETDFGSYFLSLTEEEGLEGLALEKGEDLYFRTWEPGDTILVQGKSIKLKDLFQDKKLPRPLRNQERVLVGKEIYAVGDQISDHWLKQGKRITIRKGKG